MAPCPDEMPETGETTMLATNTKIRLEKVGKVWRALYAGPNGDVTVCACNTKRATEINAEFIMRTMPLATWRAFVSRPNCDA